MMQAWATTKFELIQGWKNFGSARFAICLLFWLTTHIRHLCNKKCRILTFPALWANLPLIIVHDELWARYFWAKLSVVTPAHFCSLWLTLVLSLANYITITLALFGSLWLTLTHFASLQLTRSLLGCLNQNFETHFWHSQFHQHKLYSLIYHQFRWE